MGFFNELIVSVQCSNCNHFYEARIQFKFGATRQLEYKIGDKIIWGFNEIGKSEMTEVKVYGVLDDDACPICNNKNKNDEFDIYLEKDIITEITKMENFKDFFLNDGHYNVLAE